MSSFSRLLFLLSIITLWLCRKATLLYRKCYTENCFKIWSPLESLIINKDIFKEERWIYCSWLRTSFYHKFAFVYNMMFINLSFKMLRFWFKKTVRFKRTVMLLHVCLKNWHFFPWYTFELNSGVAINHHVVLFYLAIFF